MEWVTENWLTITLAASVLANIFVALGWKKAATYLRVVIGGVSDYVQATGNTKVEKTIKDVSTASGTELGLKPYVMKVKKGWTSPLKKTG